jgi:hypothetical protein
MLVLFDLVFMFSNFYLLDLHNETCVALENRRQSISKAWIENQNSSELVMVIKNACMLAHWNPVDLMS